MLTLYHKHFIFSNTYFVNETDIKRKKGIQYKKETGLTQTCPSNPLIEAKQQNEAGRWREERAEQRGEEEEERRGSCQLC